MQVNIKATSVTDNGNGTFSIEFPDKPLDPETVKIIEKLFPNLEDAVYTLLDKEALLGSLATPGEVLTPKVHSPKYK